MCTNIELAYGVRGIYIQSGRAGSGGMIMVFKAWRHDGKEKSHLSI